MKKTISVILTLCIALSVMAVGFVTAYADGINISGTDVTWSYDTETKVLSFGGSGAVPDYNSYKDDLGNISLTYPWKDLSYTSIVFGEGITAVGNYAFCYSSALESVVIPANVAVLGTGVFLNCKKLSSVEIASNVDISNEIFAGCTDLATVTLSGKMTAIGKNAFESCFALSEIIIPDGVTTISEDAFMNCAGLQKVVISDTVKTIGEYAFYGCENLSTLEFGSNVEIIGANAFEGCRSLEKVELPLSVKTVALNAFNSCVALNSVVLPEKLAASIGENAFDLCTELKTITIGPKITSIASKAFGYGKKGLKITGFTITGYENTEAQKYAQANGFNFVSLGNYLNGKCGETATWSFDEEKGILTISGSGAMSDFAADKLPEYSRFADRIKEISIGAEITGIGAYAFFNMSVDGMFIPETVTAIGEKAIGNYVEEALAEGFGISGFRDSAAQDYALANGIEFEDLRPIPTTGKCGENVTWSFNEETKTLTLSGTGATDSYEIDKLPEFAGYNFDIVNVTVEDGITEIGDYALILESVPEKFTFGKDIATLAEHSFGFARKSVESKYELEVGTNVTVNGYDATPVKEYAEKNEFTYVSLDKEIDNSPESVIEKSFKAKADSEKKIIVLYQTEVTKAELIEELKKAGYEDVSIEADTIGTGATVSIKLGEETATYEFIVPGDITGDGTVNSGDALAILNHSVGSSTLEGNIAVAGDINGDGNINSGDALDVLQIAVGQKEIGSFLK